MTAFSQRLSAQRLTATLLIVFLAACETVDSPLPGRVGYEDGSRPAPAEETSEPVVLVPREKIPGLDPIDAVLFEPVEEALAQGDWVAASMAMPVPVGTSGGVLADAESAGEAPEGDAQKSIARTSDSVAATPTSLDLWIDYYHARIHGARGDLRVEQEGRSALLNQALPVDLFERLQTDLLAQSRLRGDTRGRFTRALALDETNRDDEKRPQLEIELWQAAQDVVAHSAGPIDGDLAKPWLELASIAAQSSAAASVEALDRWIARYPQHAAAERADSLRAAALRDAQTQELVLLLPLSGNLERAGEALSNGFLAAYYEDQPAGLSVSVMDSRRFDTMEDAYATLAERSNSVLIGPLGKRQVGEISAIAKSELPVLTLNRPEGKTVISESTLQLSLAPEDEAQQLAASAYARGARRVLLLRPQGIWGDRMEEALLSRWNELGGASMQRGVFNQASTYSDVIKASLGIGESSARSLVIRRLFEPKVETQERRRQDLDAIFLLCKSSEEARALKPLINYHYAGDLPVYALSTADTGSNNAAINRDLNGLLFLSMPWRTGELPPGLSEDTSGSFAALHALGADAYALARRWWRVHSQAAPGFSGLTASLQPDGAALQRRLKLATFEGGAIAAP
ncbi:MAG: penicillin-binding protein activator [Pseudomonadota bacterium]